MMDGWVKLHRRIISHDVFQDPVLLKVFIWCMLKATHVERSVSTKTGAGATTIKLLPGQLLFGRSAAARALDLPLSTVRRKIERLRNLQILTLKVGTHFSIISIVNWNSYQSSSLKDEQASGQAPDRHRTQTRTKEHKNKRPAAEIPSEISELIKRYPDQEIISQVLQAIASTRKSNRIADTLKLSILQAWGKHPIESVMAAIKTYLDKGYHQEGKGEKYLRGIIRNINGADTKEAQGNTMKSTGSPALDEYYRSQGIGIL